MSIADNVELEGFLKAYPDVQMLEAMIPDMNGVLRCKRIHRREFDALFSAPSVSRSSPLKVGLATIYLSILSRAIPINWYVPSVAPLQMSPGYRLLSAKCC
jgi:hypothetical protein